MSVVAVTLASIFIGACERLGKRLSAPRPPEDAWLSRIGTGAAQTARVCARGAADRVAVALCDKSAPPIRSLVDLYAALRLDRPPARRVAVTTHSLGLSARTVSGVNPRVVVFWNVKQPDRQVSAEEIVATTFARGEQMVELVGFDTRSHEHNFYLLRFEQACNRTRCTPEDLLTERIETGWTGWTLYTDQDLEDTPLDCVSCHMPFGPGTRKQMLMRQVFDPWMHWSDFRGGDERICPVPPEGEGPVRAVSTTDGLELLRTIEGAAGRYAGVPMAELVATKSGELFAAYVADAEGLVRANRAPEDYRYEQTYFQTREVLCERYYTGKSPTWDRHRRESFDRGLPVPYFAPDVLSPARRAEVLADRAALLHRRDSEPAFDVAASMIDADVAAAIGFIPRDSDTASEILRAMCVRCHAAATDPRLRRARFNAEAIDHISPVVATAIRQRLSLPRTSPDLMPPLRVGELPGWAIARIDRYLREHETR
jgi:hypothetical protein